MDIKEIVSRAKTFLLDLDGTVYLEGELIGDMKNTLRRIRESGREIVYLTNNSSKTKEDYAARLENIGILETEDKIYTSGDATAAYLKKHFPGRRVYVMGTEKLKESFAAAGIALSETDPEVTVLAYDTESTYEKLCKTALFLRRGTAYIATHPDVNCPAKACDVPDAGSFIRLFEASVGRVPEVIVGKPFRYMAEGVSELTGRAGRELLMAGDRLYTDIRFGAENGFSSLLVLSGETTAEMYEKSETRADAVLASLNDVVKYL